MADDHNLLAALEAAVEGAPENVALRLHLAELLLDAGRTSEAIHHAAAALAIDPTSEAAQEMVRRATVTPARATVMASPADNDTSLEGDEYDELLRQVLADAGVDASAPGITLADVHGVDAVKERLEVSFLGPMRNPKLRRMYGKSLRGGLLLYGPPGCGKTFIARAVAGELGARFFPVGLHNVLDMYLGQSERNVHEIFETARRNTPCVLFLDEVDAVGQKRSHMRDWASGRNVAAQLLSELDSVGNDNEGVFVLAATNAPWDVDPALRRPGRLDRTLLVLPPDAAAREAIMAFHLRERPVEEGIDLRRLAANLDLFSGADLRLVVEAAAERALSDSVRTGKPRSISRRDLKDAAGETKPSTVAWFQQARNYVMFANEGGAFDDLLAYMREHRLT